MPEIAGMTAVARTGNNVEPALPPSRAGAFELRPSIVRRAVVGDHKVESGRGLASQRDQLLGDKAAAVERGHQNRDVRHDGQYPPDQGDN